MAEPQRGSEQPERGKTEWERLQEQRAAEERPRFSGLVWVGLVLFILALGAIGLFTFRDALGFGTPAPSRTPRPVATPTPIGSPTAVPTPAPVAWDLVGCAPDAACANEPIRREEMASYLARALELSPIEDDAFTDIADSPYRGDINAVAAARVTVGCTPTEFCPVGQVTREQLATFLQRAFSLPGTTRDFFTDDEDSTHEAAINAVAAAGIATDCGERLFCPGDFVTRAEVAGYLSRALER